MADKVRIGIDVGGTFTHAVALAGDKYEMLSQSKVPTTHTAEEGVALGIIHSLEEIMKAGIKPSDVIRVAHSTTQATNALLEGDVSAVGILSVGYGLEGKGVKSQANLDPIELAPGRFLKILHRYIDSKDAPDDKTISAALDELVKEGAGAIVAATAFSVDKPEIEKKVMETALRMGLPATATHEVSQLYGLKARTRTAAINAAILPKMIHTAVQTEKAVRKMGITAPLVVMRSDGGAMDINEMKKRPILTLLSGPAAGVAAALMAAKISDGVFLEVGGTSTDISCIVNGHPSIKMAQVGGHRLYLDTLDVRTLGIAGGSLFRINAHKHVEGVGPRSAHIAGLKYSAFPGAKPITEKAAIKMFSPGANEPQCYTSIEDDGGKWTFTTTDAANFAGLLPENDYSRGDLASVKRAAKLTGDFLGITPETLVDRIMESGAKPIITTVSELLSEKKLDKDRIRLVGGGGGASVWVHYVANKMGYPAELIEYAPVISAIGAAMALLQETVERTLIDPKPEDFAQIRHDAEAVLIKSGASPEAIEVRVEVDSQRGILRATAVGSHEMTLAGSKLTEDEMKAKAAELLKSDIGKVVVAAKTANFYVFQAEIETKKLWGLIKTKRKPWVVLDQRGRARFGASHGEIVSIEANHLLSALSSTLEKYSAFGDAGKILPAAFLVTNNRTVDLSGLVSAEQMAPICQEELKKMKMEDNVVIAVNLEGAI